MFNVSKNMKLNKNLFNRVCIGLKEGWNLPILPPHVQKVENFLSIKIFKILGNLFLFLNLSQLSYLFAYKFYISSLIFTVIYLIYRLVITFYLLKQWLYNLRTGKFLVRNSPIDSLSTIFKGTITTVKTVTNITIGLGFTYALGYELDSILLSEGKEPFFVPNLKSAVNKYGLSTYLDSVLDKLAALQQRQG